LRERKEGEREGNTRSGLVGNHKEEKKNQKIGSRFTVLWEDGKGGRREKALTKKKERVGGKKDGEFGQVEVTAAERKKGVILPT